MKSKHRLFGGLILFICSLLCGKSVLAQVVIDLPIEKAVYQRNSSNNATIPIQGSYTSKVISSVQARLVFPGTSTPVSGFNWQIIDNFPSKGRYQGSFSNVPAGSYTLEVRTVKSGTVLNSASLSRIGVGDVFLAFGQSNAQGFDSGGIGLDANSEQVVTHNYVDTCSITTPDFPIFTKITSSSFLGQHGLAWYWGKLGDHLVNSQNVPVAFFSAPASGAALHNWLESYNGGPTDHPFFNIGQYCANFNPDDTTGLGTPYIFFRKTLNYYPALFGIRAILFMQGESDNYIGTSQSEYFSRLDSLINYSRNDFGATIPWVVSRTSYFLNTTSTNVINGQNQRIAGGNQVFYGPYSDDNDSTQRSDNVHFNLTGLSNIASEWENSLTSNTYNGNSQNFFQVSSPIAAKAQPQISIQIIGNSVQMTAPSGYSGYKWVSGDHFNSSQVSTNQTFTASSGIYRCYLLDAHQNVSVSAKMVISDILNQQSLPTSCNGSVYLSDYVPYSLQNENGPVAFDQSNGGNADGDGTTQMINGVSFTKGIGVYGNSELVFRVSSGNYTTFKASIGIDDDVTTGGSVIFKVYGDNSLLYTSATLTSANAKVDINVPICGYSTIKLVTENTGDGNANDMANWSDARFTCEGVESPTALNLYKIGSSCLGLNWSPPTSGAPLYYEIYLNGNVVATVNSSSTSYLFENLSKQTAYTVGVKAVICSSVKSPLSSLSTSTVRTYVTYSQEFNFICFGEEVTPVIENPGGVFTITSGAELVSQLNSSTGSIILNNAGSVGLRYIIDAGTACADTFNISLYGREKPLPPVISASTNLLQSGDTLNLSSNTDCQPNSIIWSNGNTLASFSVVLSDTTAFSAQCKDFGCYSNSSNVISINVIPDCPQSFYLESTSSDLNYGTNRFDLFAQDQIEAINKIYSPTGAFFRAGQTIELNPGFEARSGSVFSATIQGCP